MPITIRLKPNRSNAQSSPSENPKLRGSSHATSKQASRERGRRAGLTRETILKVCRERLSSGQELSIAGIAKACGVAPNAIYSRFERGISALELELAREVMVPLGRSIKPNEVWSAYLRVLFLEAADLVQASPELARLISPAVASEPYICPRLNDRILFCLASANVPTAHRANLMFFIMDVLVGLTNKPKPESKVAQEGWAAKLGHSIAGLPESELPQLAEHASLLKAATSNVGGGKNGTGLVTSYADFVLAVVHARASDADQLA